MLPCPQGCDRCGEHPRMTQEVLIYSHFILLLYSLVSACCTAHYSWREVVLALINSMLGLDLSGQRMEALTCASNQC